MAQGDIVRFKSANSANHFLLLNANNSTATTVYGDKIIVKYGHVDGFADIDKKQESEVKEEQK